MRQWATGGGQVAYKRSGHGGEVKNKNKTLALVPFVLFFLHPLQQPHRGRKEKNLRDLIARDVKALSAPLKNTRRGRPPLIRVRCFFPVELRQAPCDVLALYRREVHDDHRASDAHNDSCDERGPP